MMSRLGHRLQCWAALACALCATAGAEPAPGAAPRADHIVLVIEENKPYAGIIGSADAPYINRLAARGALFTNSFGVAHPSQPNYLALFSGSTHGVPDDRCPLELSGPNLAAALADRGADFAIFSESLPAPGERVCFADGHRYARKHNPIAEWPELGGSARVNRTFAQFPVDYAQLPAVAFVVPDQEDDMHDGATPTAQVAAGDRWLSRNIDGYARWAAGHNSLLIVTWDEDDGSANNHVATLIVGAGVKAGLYPTRIDHYDVLRTIEDLRGLAPLGHAAEARGVGPIWLPAVPATAR